LARGGFINIINAIKSGKRFRANGICGYAWIKISSPTAELNFTSADLLREDFEIEEESVTVTRSQIICAWLRVHPDFEGAPIEFEGFLKALGFKE
jgi:hypothetical protein